MEAAIFHRQCLRNIQTKGRYIFKYQFIILLQDLCGVHPEYNFTYSEIYTPINLTLRISNS